MTRLAAIICLALTSSGALSAADLVIPIAGEWRGTHSVLTVSNVANATTDIEVSFIPASTADTLVPIRIRKAASATEEIDIGKRLLGGAQAVGGVRIRSNNAIEATLRLFDAAAPDRAGTFLAVPLRDAIANGESTTISGPALGDHGLRLFVAETRGFPLYFSATFRTAAGRVVSSRRFYVGPLRQSTHAIETDMPVDRSEPFTIELHGLNGSGRVVAAAATIAPDKGITALDMTRRRGLRHAMPPAEALAYALAAGFVAIGAVYAAKK